MHHLTRYINPQILLISLHDTRVWCSEDRIIKLKISFTCQQISEYLFDMTKIVKKTYLLRSGAQLNLLFPKTREKPHGGGGFFYASHV